MYELRFKERPDKNLSVQQLMGIEGFRVKETYRLLAQKYRVTWHGRRYDPKDWEKGDIANRCISAATSCLYGITEAAVLAAAMRRQSVLFTAVNLYRLCMTSQISSSLTP